MKWSLGGKVGLVTLAAALALGACSGGASPTPAEPEENVIYFGTGATQAEIYLLPVLITARQILADQGISLEYAALSNDEVVSSAVDRGRIDVALQSLLGAQRAINAGLGMQWVLTNETQNTFVLVVPSEVEDLTQLRGMKIGVQDATSLSGVILPALMLDAGVATEEYETVYLAGSSNRAAALAAGSMDASVLLRDIAASVEEDTDGAFKIWGAGGAALDPMMWEGFVMSDSFRENETLANAFVDASLEAYRQFYEGDPGEMAEAMLTAEERPETAGIEVDVAAEDFRFYQEIELFPTDGGLDQALYDRMSDLLVEVGQLEEADVVPYEDVVDTSFVEAAQ